MKHNGQTICLNMIVKNEADVIRRCLDSVKGIIDHWVIVDTGSTDGTQDIIREHLREIPGELHERPWRDFAHNRSEALHLARHTSTFTLIIDADDMLEFKEQATIPLLEADSYTVIINDTGFIYRRPQLVRSALNWRYEGVLHEYITCDDDTVAAELSGIEIRLNQDGARRKDPSTYRRDAVVLETALATETNPFLVARYRFYLAQSYRDSGQFQQSLDNYLARARLGFWEEEVFISLYCAAQLMEQLGYPDDVIIRTYQEASDAVPARAEALYRASRFCRLKGHFDQGYSIAKSGLDIPLPADGLFIEPGVYEMGLLDEFSINAYWAGHDSESLEACLTILINANLSHTEKKRIASNAQFASRRLTNLSIPPIAESPMIKH